MSGGNRKKGAKYRKFAQRKSRRPPVCSTNRNHQGSTGGLQHPEIHEKLPSSHLFADRIMNWSEYVEDRSSLWGPQASKASSIVLDKYSRSNFPPRRQLTPLSWIKSLHENNPKVLKRIFCESQDWSVLEGMAVHGGINLTAFDKNSRKAVDLVTVYRLQLKSGHYLTSTSDIAEAALQGLYARVIAFCLNENQIAVKCMQNFSKIQKNSLFLEAIVDFWTYKPAPFEKLRLEPTFYRTGIENKHFPKRNPNSAEVPSSETSQFVISESLPSQQEPNEDSNFGVEKVLLNDISPIDAKRSCSTSKNGSLQAEKCSTVEFDENNQKITVVRITKTINRVCDDDSQEDKSRRKRSRFSDSAATSIAETTVPDDTLNGMKCSGSNLDANDAPASVLEVCKIERPVDSPKRSASEEKTKLSLSQAFICISSMKFHQQESARKVRKWPSFLADQIALANLENQFPAQKIYSITMLNKFSFVEDVDFEVIAENRVKQSSSSEMALTWFVELRLNNGVLKFYGKSKAKWSKALNYALIVALNFCTLKMLHEKVVARHLKNETQFLLSCFLNPEDKKENDLEKQPPKLPDVELKPKRKQETVTYEQVVKRRKRSKSVGRANEDVENGVSIPLDDPIVFEVNLKNEKTHFCFEKTARDCNEALNYSLLHILENNYNYSVL